MAAASAWTVAASAASWALSKSTRWRGLKLRAASFSARTSVAARIGQRRLVARLDRLGLSALGGEGPGVDLRQHGPGPDLLAFGEVGP
jgi:hypothetical protein